jgi:hypothetical protein
MLNVIAASLIFFFKKKLLFLKHFFAFQKQITFRTLYCFWPCQRSIPKDQFGFFLLSLSNLFQTLFLILHIIRQNATFGTGCFETFHFEMKLSTKSNTFGAVCTFMLCHPNYFYLLKLAKLSL